MPITRQVEFDDLPAICAARRPEGEETSSVEPTPPPGAGISPNPVTELVADLLETTGLVRADRLAAGALAGGHRVHRPGARRRRAREPAVDTRRLALRANELAGADPGRSLASSAGRPRRGGSRQGRCPVHPDTRARARGRHPLQARGQPALRRRRRPDERSDDRRAAPRHALHARARRRPAEDIELELRRIVRATEAWERAALVEDELDEDGEPAATTSRPMTASPTRRSSASSTRSSSRRPRTAPAISTSIRRTTRSSSGCASTACCTRCSGIPKRLAPGVTTRLKVLAKLDIAERRKPQDGRISLNAKAAGPPARHPRRRPPDGRGREGGHAPPRQVEAPADADGARPLGRDAGAVRGRSSASRPARCSSPGPTGSGKSTTLYARADARSTGRRSTSSPSRTRSSTGSPGVNQIQINPKAGLTFANALRTILRSDPDVIMVGEIRDVETAKISIEAALTGHFVLSTLHTNDAPSALTRLNEMGVEPFLTGSAVTAVLAQRLAAQALHALLRDVHAHASRRCSPPASRPSRSRRRTGSPCTASAAARAATRPATRAASASSSSWS